MYAKKFPLENLIKKGNLFFSEVPVKVVLQSRLHFQSCFRQTNKGMIAINKIEDIITKKSLFLDGRNLPKV